METVAAAAGKIPRHLRKTCGVKTAPRQAGATRFQSVHAQIHLAGRRLPAGRGFVRRLRLGENRGRQNRILPGRFSELAGKLRPASRRRKVAQNLLRRNISVNSSGFIVYPEVCTAFGALRFASAAVDKALEQKLIDRYAVLLTPEGNKMISPERHVDFHVFGVLPLEIYLLDGDTNYLALGLSKADGQWENPLPNGLARESRWWVDDAFMTGSLQIQAYR